MAGVVMTTKEKGEAMIAWAQKVKCPMVVKYSDFETITDTTLHLSTQVSTMQANAVGSQFWVLAYMRILRLKQFLTDKKKTNEKANV